MSFRQLLADNGFTMADVDALFAEKTDRLKHEKDTITTTHSDGTTVTRDTGRVVTHRQSNADWKMFVAEEVFFEDYTEVRLGYYAVSRKKLREDGDLELVWSRSPPMFPTEDLGQFVQKLSTAGLLDSTNFAETASPADD